MLHKHWIYFFAIFKQGTLEIPKFGSFFRSYIIEEIVDSWVMYFLVERCNIRHCNINIFGIKATVINGCLSAFTDSSTDPFPIVNLFEKLDNAVMVVSSLLD